MIVPDLKYRPNPERAIFVQGMIDQPLVDRLTPQILRLQHQSRDPITVYIDSRGGSVAHAEVLRRLLRSPNQDLCPSCWLITVVTSRAASAAADILAAGDYAIAYPDSTILFHGVRTSLENPLTVEVTSFLAETLKLSNDRHAMALARESEWRFMFRFVNLRNEFPEFRQKNPQATTDLDCLLGLLAERVSPSTQKVIRQADERYRRYDALLEKVLRVAGRSKAFYKTQAHQEAAILKAIVNFELASNRGKSDWTFTDGGLRRIADDFLLLDEYLTSSQSDQFRRICERWSHFVLTDEEMKALDRLGDDERRKRLLEMARPHFRPIWAFFVALCHALQEGENEVNAHDAFWLGLVDEIYGEVDLPSLRLIREIRDEDGIQSRSAGA